MNDEININNEVLKENLEEENIPIETIETNLTNEEIEKAKEEALKNNVIIGGTEKNSSSMYTSDGSNVNITSGNGTNSKINTSATNNTTNENEEKAKEENNIEESNKESKWHKYGQKALIVSLIIALLIALFMMLRKRSKEKNLQKQNAEKEKTASAEAKEKELNEKNKENLEKATTAAKYKLSAERVKKVEDEYRDKLNASINKSKVLATNTPKTVSDSSQTKKTKTTNNSSKTKDKTTKGKTNEENNTKTASVEGEVIPTPNGDGDGKGGGEVIPTPNGDGDEKGVGEVIPTPNGDDKVKWFETTVNGASAKFKASTVKDETYIHEMKANDGTPFYITNHDKEVTRTWNTKMYTGIIINGKMAQFRGSTVKSDLYNTEYKIPDGNNKGTTIYITANDKKIADTWGLDNNEKVTNNSTTVTIYDNNKTYEEFEKEKKEKEKKAIEISDNTQKSKKQILDNINHEVDSNTKLTETEKTRLKKYLFDQTNKGAAIYTYETLKRNPETNDLDILNREYNNAQYFGGRNIRYDKYSIATGDDRRELVNQEVAKIISTIYDENKYNETTKEIVKSTKNKSIKVGKYFGLNQGITDKKTTTSL